MTRANTGDAATTPNLRIEIRDGVGRICLDQPERHNAISLQMWAGLARACEQFAADSRIRVVVIRGEGGRAFSAGADISEFEHRRGSPETVSTYDDATSRAMAGLRALPQPTLAWIEGYCLGGGLALALGCDLRFASSDSELAIPAARLGVGYGYGGVRMLVDLVGPAAAKEILYTGRRFSASEAERMGLVNRALPRAELEELVESTISQIAANAPLTVRASKRIVAETLKDPDRRNLELCRRLVAQCFESEDYREGRRAFLEKRPPRFRGR